MTTTTNAALASTEIIATNLRAAAKLTKTSKKPSQQQRQKQRYQQQTMGRVSPQPLPGPLI